jgi:hypothetical protein
MVEKVDESGLRSWMILELFVAKESEGTLFVRSTRLVKGG